VMFEDGGNVLTVRYVQLDDKQYQPRVGDQVSVEITSGRRDATDTSPYLARSITPVSANP